MPCQTVVLKSALEYTHQNSPVIGISLDPDTRNVLIATSEGSVYAKSLNKEKPSIKLSHYQKSSLITALAYSKLHHMLVATFEDGRCCVWNSFSVQEIPQTLRLHQKFISSVDFSDKYSCFLSCSLDKSLKLWKICQQYSDKKSIEPPLAFECSIQAHKNWINCGRFNFSQNRLASGSDDKTVKIWDHYTSQRKVALRSFRLKSQPIRTLAWISDQTLCSGDDAGTINVLDDRSPRTGVVQHYPNCVKGFVSSLCSLSQTTSSLNLICGSSEGIIKMFDLRKGQENLCIEAHSAGLTGLIGLQEGPQGNSEFLSSALDSKILKWNVKSNIN